MGRTEFSPGTGSLCQPQLDLVLLWPERGEEDREDDSEGGRKREGRRGWCSGATLTGVECRMRREESRKTQCVD